MKKENDLNFECKYLKDEYCRKIKHHIRSGYARTLHCKNCKYFKKLKRGEKTRGGSEE